MKHFYTIGEVSKLLDVKPHVIRYWESEFSMLRPRRDGGRNRRYTRENILLLKKIQDMLHNQRYTIAGARAQLKAEAKAKKQSKQLLGSKELRGEMLELRGKLEQIISLCEAINKEDK